MQTQKSEVRQKILDAAAEEFYQNGYEKAVMRSIASSAGVTAGNIYSYFKGKDELYMTLVEDTMGLLDSFIAQLSKSESTVRLVDISQKICEIFAENKKPFLILLSGAEYSIKETLSGWIAVRLSEDYLPLVMASWSEEVVNALAWAVVEGLLRIMRDCSDDMDEMNGNVSQFLYLVVGSGLVVHQGQEGNTNGKLC
jgi:AcrR family transcriptional regulator